ncbi:MAG: thioredoxin domain-containing protein, partial [Chloroflexi bacterium]|nr:thioredoxin domain-containing protein [Chloroflexota bacterium]
MGGGFPRGNCLGSKSRLKWSSIILPIMNRLARSTSPYLLQHANNPVEWQPWGDQAINQARLEDKPIFLSVGYAACHWCHVMAHESFENEEVASFLNRHFINIKVDREERPDIDGIYMQAVVAMTGSGGWPMSVFLGHDLAPFYGGTYFPPSRKFNLPSFMDVLLGISNAWKNEREELLKVGEKIRIHLTQTTSSSTSGSIAPQQFNSIAANLRSTYDWGYGGWGDAPKFPQPMVTEFLLQHSLLESGEELQRLIGHYLQALARGGMYDVVGGGFSRYSTDRFWRIPHFEKMLYDNALLARQYLHAWQVLREPLFRRVAEETIEFVTREMTNNAGGFYSSLDADSEGQEGKFYAWTLEEIRSALGSDSELFESAYGISALGNWEGKTILQRALDDASLASRFKLDLETVSANIGSSHALLLAARNLRIRPSTDEKIITAWNGLMLATFSEAARILNNQGYLKVATRNAEFLLSEK